MNVKNLVNIYHKEINKETIIFSPKVQMYCKLPYPGHENGCPNYGKNSKCPPNAPYRVDILKKYCIFNLIVAEFNIGLYIELYRKEHPERSLNQLRNCLYWQPSIKAIVKNYINTKLIPFNEMFGAGSGFWNYCSMEAVGMHVFKILRLNGIEFDVKARKKVLMVCLVVKKNKTRLF